ncbi:hypothetical protein Tco_0220456 [Tanacetum coccineum]
MFGTNIEETVTNDNANNDDTDNVTTNVVNEEDHPELLDSRGGSHVTNVPQLDVEDFSSWKDRFLVYLVVWNPFFLKS